MDRQLVAIWRPERQGFEYVERESRADHRHLIEREDYGDRGFTGKLGVIHETGQYTGERVMFRLDDHLRRFEQTAAAISSIGQLPCSVEFLTRTVLEIARNNGQMYIRCSIGGGGGTRVYSHGQSPRLIVFTEGSIDPITKSYLGPQVVEHGMRVLVTDQRRGFPDALTMAKCAANYPRSIAATHQAKMAGYDEGVLLDWTGQHLSELSVANLVIICGRLAYTPAPQSGALNSITRRTSETILQELYGIPTDPVLVTPKLIASADEIFACGTAVANVRIRELDWPEVGLSWRLERRLEEQIVPRLDQVYVDLLRGISPESHPNFHPEWFTPVNQQAPIIANRR